MRLVQLVRRYLDLRATSLALAILIAFLAILTIAEVSLPESSAALPILSRVDTALTLLFALELAARVAVAPPRARLRTFASRWIDLLAILPAIPIIHAVRALRLLRILRIFAIPRLFRRHGGLVPRRGARELAFAVAVLVIIVPLASAALVSFEHDTFGDAAWITLHTLFAADPPPNPPHTIAGRVVSISVMFLGLGMFATLTGTVSAFIADRLRSEENSVDWEDLSGHLIICGWNRKAELVVREHRDAGAGSDMPIVVISEIEGEPHFSDPTLKKRVQFLNDDFTKIAVLEKAGIRRAATCILLSDTSRGRRERDADARTVLAALTIEKLHPQAYVCAEINRRENGDHLAIGNVRDYVVSGEHSAFLLAQAAIHRGVVSVFTELVSYAQLGNKLQRRKVSLAWKGKTFFDLFVHLKKEREAILVAVADPDGTMRVNPPDYAFRGNEEIVLIATGDVEI